MNLKDEDKEMIQLRTYQRDAVNKMRNGCILCGGVGSGKSLTALAYYFKEHGGDLDDRNGSWMKSPKNLFIITTARKRDTLEWEKELGQFLLSTNPEACGYKDLNVVVNSWNNIGKYKEVEGSFFIFDEDRVVGSGAWVKAFLKIASHNNWIILSATPGDTFMDYIPVFIANGFYKNRSEFLREHVIFSRFVKFPKVDRYVGIPKLVRLRDRILVDMDFHRETISHHEDVFVPYDIQKYKDIARKRWNPWKDEPIVNASEFCFCLRRVVNEDEARQIMVLEILEKHPKAIIFYNFDYELEILKEMAKANGLECAEWNGHKHQEIPEGDGWVYLVQYNAGSDGWNCIKTDTIIFYSQNYSYKTMVQAAGRIDRMNTPFIDLYFYHIKSRSGIDLAISGALKRKKNFNEGKFFGGK